MRRTRRHTSVVMSALAVTALLGAAACTDEDDDLDDVDITTDVDITDDDVDVTTGSTGTLDTGTGDTGSVTPTSGP